MVNIMEKEYPDMQRSITFFVTINADPKKDLKAVDKLFRLPEVKEIHTLNGSIDILLKVVLNRDLLTSDAEVIDQFVHEKIRQHKGILATETLIPISSQTKN